MAALANELQTARNVQSLEQNIAVTAQRSEMQSQQTRAQADGSRQAQIQKVRHDYENERLTISNAVSALVNANRRFFQGIDGEDHAKAEFEPPGF